MKFHPEVVTLMQERKRAYSLLFGNSVAPHIKLVIEDLSKFCREKTTTFHMDPRLHAALEGRREVMLRIRDYIELSVDELCEKYAKNIAKGIDNG